MLSTGVGAIALLLLSCNTAGSAWMAQPLGPVEPEAAHLAESPWQSAHQQRPAPRPPVRRIAAAAENAESVNESVLPTNSVPVSGRSLGQFRNTYYDFPNEADFDGSAVPLMNARCEAIGQVARGFYESVCVQGSGTLRTGKTVSYSRRDCACAEVCPRTQQKICFDVLEPNAFPWGRGATGKAITPFVTVAVDPEVIPLGTAIYVPEFDGVPRDPSGISTHDGCFIAQDKGIRVKGKHIDVFTGDTAMTLVWNQRVPSNRGVSVFVESPRCRRLP